MGRTADFDEMLQKKYALMARAQDNEDARTKIMGQNAGTSKYTAETGRLGLAPETTKSNAAMINARANQADVAQQPARWAANKDSAMSQIRESAVADNEVGREAWKRTQLSAANSARNAPPEPAKYVPQSTGETMVNQATGLTQKAQALLDKNKTRNKKKPDKYSAAYDKAMGYAPDQFGFN